MQSISIHTQSANLSEEQFFMLCSENRELRIERDKDKNIIIMAPTFSETGKHNFAIALKLGLWNEKQKSGYCFDSSAGFTLPNGAMRAPDVSWIKKEKWDGLSKENKDRFAHICPDFIIEVRSKTDNLKQLKEKMEEWITNGCQLAWLIDIENRITYIYKPTGEVTEQLFDTGLAGENVLPEFELRLDEIITL